MLHLMTHTSPTRPSADVFQSSATIDIELRPLRAWAALSSAARPPPPFARLWAQCAAMRLPSPARVPSIAIVVPPLRRRAKAKAASLTKCEEAAAGRVLEEKNGRASCRERGFRDV